MKELSTKNVVKEKFRLFGFNTLLFSLLSRIQSSKNLVTLLVTLVGLLISIEGLSQAPGWRSNPPPRNTKTSPPMHVSPIPRNNLPVYTGRSNSFNRISPTERGSTQVHSTERSSSYKVEPKINFERGIVQRREPKARQNDGEAKLNSSALPNVNFELNQTQRREHSTYKVAPYSVHTQEEHDKWRRYEEYPGWRYTGGTKEVYRNTKCYHHWVYSREHYRGYCAPYFFRYYYIPYDFVYIRVPDITYIEYKESSSLYYLDSPYGYEYSKRIERAFLDNNMNSLEDLMPDIVAVYLGNKYQYSIPSQDYLNITTDALSNMQTVDFKILGIKNKDGRYILSGVHRFSVDGETYTKKVSFVIEDGKIIQVGAL